MYVAPDSENEVYVNDSTYEEAGSLKKVNSLLQKARYYPKFRVLSLVLLFNDRVHFL